jgi:hypothetical protein
MATTTILHVGDDICQRIPVMEQAGFVVLQSQGALPALRSILSSGDALSAVVFHSDFTAPPDPVVRETRALSVAPFILFQNPTISCDEDIFDLVIPVLTPPAVWLKKLKDVIRQSRALCERAQQLGADCESVRSQSRALRAASARNRRRSIDPDALWRGKAPDSPDSNSPDDSAGQGPKD